MASTKGTEEFGGNGGRRWFRVPRSMFRVRCFLFPIHDPVPRNQIVTEHADRAPPKSGKRIHFEFQVQCVRREPFAQFMQSMLVRALIPKPVASKKDVEFQIVVGRVAGFSFQHSALSTTITAAEHERFKFVCGNNRFEAFADGFTKPREPFFQFIAAVEREAQAHDVALSLR